MGPVVELMSETARLSLKFGRDFWVAHPFALSAKGWRWFLLAAVLRLILY
jgi:hypothetical protein